MEAEALASIECIRDRKNDPPAPFLKLALSQQSGKQGEVETRAAVYAYVRPSSVAALVPSALREGSYELLLHSGSKGGQVFEGCLEERVRVIAAS